MIYFAHDTGVSHEEVEQIQTVTQTNYLNDIAVSVLPFFILLVIWLALSAAKCKLVVKINVTLIYLLVVGLTTYAIAPVASIVALVTGFGLALFVVITKIKT